MKLAEDYAATIREALRHDAVNCRGCKAEEALDALVDEYDDLVVACRVASERATELQELSAAWIGKATEAEKRADHAYELGFREGYEAYAKADAEGADG